MIALVYFHNEGVIRIKSEGYKPLEIDLSDLSPVPEEKGTSAALIRGIAAKFAEMGVETGGFNAYMTSDVLSGSGLSSSAAFENLIGTIIDHGFNNGAAGAVEIAKIGQYAENVYFGKACGLMDQIVSSVGGFAAIDLSDPAKPEISPVEFDFAGAGYSLCITDTKGSHADLTDDYTAIPAEMKSVAKALGAEYLRDVNADTFYKKLPELREVCSDRAILRAAHFFDENERVQLEAEALAGGDLEEFFQAFVPTYLAPRYAAELDRIFGEGSCHILSIRPVGGTEIKIN